MDYLGWGSAANLSVNIMTHFFSFCFVFTSIPEGIKISTSVHHLGVQTKTYNSMPFIPISTCSHSVGMGNTRAFLFSSNVCRFLSLVFLGFFLIRLSFSFEE